jgi:REP element-mobilizing transposase RayT
MPRHARLKEENCYYYVQQCGKTDLEIFKTKKLKLLFLTILEEVKAKYNIKIYGISINKNGYCLYLHNQGSDISKIMKSINISFAMQYKSFNLTGDIFKDRYKSDIISEKLLKELIKKLPSCVYVKQGLINSVDDLPECEGICIKTSEKAKKYLDKRLIETSTSYDEMLKTKALRNKYIKELRTCSVISLKELGTLFNISESGISRILSR